MIGTAANTHRILAAVAAAIALVGLGCQSGGSPTTAGSGAGQEPAAVIVISDAPAEFEPKTLTIKVGDTVEWRNTGGIAHSVEFVGEALPKGVASSPTGIMQPNGSYSYTFTAPGSYGYICRFHVINGMIAKIIVVADHPASGTTAGTR